MALVPVHHACVIEASPEEVWAWHARPGALRRLLPPWQPVAVVRESTSLAHGRAELRLPGGIRWVAEHDPTGFEAGRQFVDVLATPVLRRILPWRHTHRLLKVNEGTCVEDCVDTILPARFVGPLLAYRCRQLRDDLAAHRHWSRSPRTVALTGASGLIGSALAAFLASGGHRVIRLVRGRGGRLASIAEQGKGEAALPEASSHTDGSSGPEAECRPWQIDDPDPRVLEGVDAVVHLAGAPVGGRFTAAHKRAVLESRVEPTRRLARAADRAGVEVFLSASAIGWYGAARGDEELDERAASGSDFLARVVAAWEEAASAGAGSRMRVCQVRTGVVLSPRGGALALQLPLFRLGLGGRLGSGRQWVSWIALDDVLDVYLRAIVDPSLSGPLNATAPAPVRNAELAATLGRVLRRPAVVAVPSLGPRLLLGSEGAALLAAASQRVLPRRLLDAGHRFRHPELEQALHHMLGRTDGQGLRVAGTEACR
jgi:uncharacterized protein (TIGR01777 family)